MFKKLTFSLILFLWFLTPKTASAQEFRTDYKAEYFIDESVEGVGSRVKYNITVTNLEDNFYITRFQLKFPKSFEISNLSARDDYDRIVPNLTEDDNFTQINLALNNPGNEESSISNIYLEFSQRNLFKINGNVWEVILPTILGDSKGSYQILVHLPENSDKKISIAKPKPTSISGRTITWSNPATRTVYAVFGDKQYYNLELKYNLENPKLTTVYTEIALPPDTTYQKAYIRSVEPKPSETFTDEDGNFLARYFLKPKERKTIAYSGLIEVSTAPREIVKSYHSNLYSRNKNSLLSEQKYWQIKDLSKINALKTISDIYYFTANNLKYDYSRVTKNVSRIGADVALKNPQSAVCTEFSDVFVAVAREKGIAAREIQGYGFSNDKELRPLSLVADVLHSWPEYYDVQKNLWTPVDPTWENTSGIDYFNSFDLNHVVFAIHGKRSDYPHPAGSYKIEDSRDIKISASTEIPSEQQKLVVSEFINPKRLNDKEYSPAKVIVENQGNAYAWNLDILFEGENLEIAEPQTTIEAIAPYEKKELNVGLKANGAGGAELKVLVQGKQLFRQSVDSSPRYLEILVKALIVGGVLAIGLLFLKKYRRKLKI